MTLRFECGQGDGLKDWLGENAPYECRVSLVPRSSEREVCSSSKDSGFGKPSRLGNEAFDSRGYPKIVKACEHLLRGEKKDEMSVSYKLEAGTRLRGRVGNLAH